MIDPVKGSNERLYRQRRISQELCINVYTALKMIVRLSVGIVSSRAILRIILGSISIIRENDFMPLGLNPSAQPQSRRRRQ